MVQTGGRFRRHDPIKVRPLTSELAVFDGPLERFLAEVAARGEPAPTPVEVCGRTCHRASNGTLALPLTIPDGAGASVLVGTAEAVRRFLEVLDGTPEEG